MIYLFGKYYRVARNGDWFYQYAPCDGLGFYSTRAWWSCFRFLTPSWILFSLRMKARAKSEYSVWEKSKMASFRNMAIATKRARNHGLKTDGQFTPVGNSGPLIAARNYCMLLDAYPDSDYLGYLVVMNMWAESLNRYCDNHFIERDEALSHALGSFLSRQIVDATVLQ